MNTLWRRNDIPDEHEFLVEDGSCFDPDSDMDAPADEEGYSYAFVQDYPEGFFCGI